MGRSVDCLNHAEYVLYFPFECEEETVDFEWDDTLCNLKASIIDKFPSYRDCDRWDGRETRIILENQLCEIGISEYCGLVSLSIRVSEQACWEYFDGTGLAVNHTHQVRKSLEQAVTEAGMQLLTKLGTFSNGEAVFEKAAG